MTFEIFVRSILVKIVKEETVKVTKFIPDTVIELLKTSIKVRVDGVKTLHTDNLTRIDSEAKKLEKVTLLIKTF